jgi:hypothetical protein
MALQRAEASLKRCERRIGVLRGKTLRRQALDRKQLTGYVLLRLSNMPSGLRKMRPFHPFSWQHVSHYYARCQSIRLQPDIQIERVMLSDDSASHALG